jgi:hypothetical protein
VIVGRYFLSTGPRRLKRGGYWHVLLAVRRRWRAAFVQVHTKPGYRRFYFGPFEIEWSVRP